MFIYKTTNLINDKIYIGKSNGNRKGYLGSGILLKRAIKKYGYKNFKNDIIEDNIDNESILNEKEIYWINFYDSKNLEIGYNLVNGGEGGDITNRKGKTLDEIYGKEKSEQIRNNIIISTSGSNSYNYGKKVSEETRRKISETKKGVFASEETKKKMSGPRPLTSGSANSRFGTHLTENQKKHLSSIRKGIKTGKQKRKKINSNINKNNGNFSSKYFGVSKIKNSKRWRARIRISEESITFEIGSFFTEVEAALAYNEMALELHGWKAKLNIISQEELNDIWN